MNPAQRKWLKVAIALVVGAYVPFAIGGWKHPAEINLASYGTWFLLSLTFGYSMWDQGHESWKLLLGFLFGNGFMCVFALLQGGYTFDLEPAESLTFFGLIGTMCIAVVWATIFKWESRILLYGSLLSDMGSIYPQFKQYYLMPHEPMTLFGFAGWATWFIAICVTLLMVEQMPFKLQMGAAVYRALYGKEKSPFLIVEESIFSLSQITYIPIVVVMMAR